MAIATALERNTSVTTVLLGCEYLVILCILLFKFRDNIGDDGAKAIVVALEKTSQLEFS